MRKPALSGALILLVVNVISVHAAFAVGPAWHVNGVKLNQGVRQLKMQTKGSYIQRYTISEIKVITECHKGFSEGAAIEGSGANPGQGKGRLVFEECVLVSPHSCRIVEPIVTNQSKASLVTYTGMQSKYAILFEPQQGLTFSKYTITKNSGESCLIEGEYLIAGTVAAELIPKEAEVQEGLISFPATPISTVFRGGEEIKVGLRLGTNEFLIEGVFGARLTTNERFGVFGQ